VEALEAVHGPWQAAGEAALNLGQPQILALKKSSESARLNAEVQGAGNWPTVKLSARSSMDYPDSIVLEAIQQNTFTVSAVWPLFAFGQVGKLVDQQNALAASRQNQLEQAVTDLTRDWQKARDELKGLRSQKEIGQQAVEVSQTYYRLADASYRNGQTNLLDVQSAEHKLLESKERLASTQTHILIELATLASLTE
jgi:outer membrane protein TolC